MPARKLAKKPPQSGDANEAADGRKRKHADDFSVFDFSSPAAASPCRAGKKRAKQKEEPAERCPPAADDRTHSSANGVDDAAPAQASAPAARPALGRRRAGAARADGAGLASGRRGESPPTRPGRGCGHGALFSEPPPVESLRCTALHVRATAVLLHDFVLMVEPGSLTALVPSPKQPHAISSSADARADVSRLVLHRDNITRIGFSRPREGMSWVLMVCLRDEVPTFHHGQATELTFELKRSTRTSPTLPQDTMLALLTSYFQPPSKSSSSIHPDDVNVRALQVVAARRERTQSQRAYL
ncbi:hypothetical protein DIPPA_12804 [Diplonema papillatum]|nr:hypothetical protein DIPPA_12804 [Diplonema papillatum]